MKVFRELELLGSNEELLEALENIKRKAGEELELDEAWATSFKKNFPKDQFVICAVFPKKEDRPEARLWLIQTENREGVFKTYVSNIVTEKGLGYEQYNEILLEFKEKFIDPIVESKAIKVNLTPGEVTIEDIAGENVASLIKAYSNLANRTNSHPLDEERWYRFVIAAHKENSKLTAGELRRWLIEEEEWHEDGAWELCIKYESQRELLIFYDDEDFTYRR